MYGKIALSFATAALILAAGGFLAVWNRLGATQKPARPPATRSVVGETPTTQAPGGEAKEGRPPTVIPDAPPGGPDDLPTTSTDSEKLVWLIQKLQEMSDSDYDTYTEFSQDLFELKREVRHLKATLKQVIRGLGKGPGGTSAIGWGLAPPDAPLTPELMDAYRKAAAEHGVKVEEGRVTVRGFLNISPRTNMPIEYFITRFPESNHETLVHLLGNKNLEDLGDNQYRALAGLATALYKGMIAAGFEQGEPGHPDMDSDPKDPDWILASGETVYMAVRYELDGQMHVARATDWIVDPAANAVLPPDCFRFSGGTRMEDHDTGEDVLSAEAMGLLVSVWPTYTAIVEVALDSSRRNDYTYNFARIPKPTGEGPLYLDVVFSKTPIEPEGGGAKPLEREPAGDTGVRPIEQPPKDE